MKKLLLTVAVAVLGLASCTLNEVTADRYENNAIEFSTYTGNAVTKGEVVDNAYIQANGFGVTAFYTEQSAWSAFTPAIANFMWNQSVTYSDPNWTYTPVKYWPATANDKISFFAYAPYQASANSNGIVLPAKDATSDLTSVGFTVQDVAENMVDFVAAVAIDKQQTTSYGAQEAVAFNFKHELSRLNFYAKLDENLVEKDITNIVITEIELAAADEFYKTATYTFANENGKRGTWKHGDKMTTYNISGVLGFAATNTLLGKDYAGANVKPLTTDQEVALFADDAYLFLIPAAPAQDGTEGTAADEFKVTIYYDILTKDANLSVGYSCTSTSKTVSLPVGILKQGEAYKVIFEIFIDQIKVTASVEEWKETTLGEVPVPQM